MGNNKDTAEVIKFLGLFAKLKDRSDDDPERLPDLAKNDKVIKEFCGQLSWIAHFLKMNERRHRQLFAAPVDPKFLTEWRDFEERFEPVLTDILFTDLFQDLDAAEPIQASKAD
jgi:hypothetical protein